MKKLLMIVIFIMLFPVTVQADVAPKRQVNIAFENMPETVFYATLISPVPCTGRYGPTAKDGGYDLYDSDDREYDIWKAFAEFGDEDGMLFQQCFEKCSDSGQFRWFERPPHRFKILLYFPESDNYAVSDKIYSQYAFYSNFVVDLNGVDSSEAMVLGSETIQKSNNYKPEVTSAAACMAATIILELLIGLLFGYRTGREIKIIIITNVLTQLFLNILLVTLEIHQGPWAYIFHYIWMEVLITGTEAVVYRECLGTSISNGTKKGKKPVVYAVAANLFSFGTGLIFMGVLQKVFWLIRILRQ
ncbi:hypothetical protein MCG98_15280 [Ruminococcus sp. OA3]|uniref:hypothetical protein n=1 Tax=Ruminococcus sp. OA3 TaxID=2914164 RepID=UPI001F052B76|nr:hypothetical protein [Ruminococcus sp. OA3]MCH1983931.1 hypothetical protein [Ruminococcus sp. OA3]